MYFPAPVQGMVFCGNSNAVIIRSQKSGFVFHHICAAQGPISGLQPET